MLRRLPHHADGLIMPAMPNIHDLIALTDEPQHLTMDFAHQRARRVNDEHAAPFSFRLHLRRHAMRGEHHRHTRSDRIIGDFGQFLDKHRALGSEIVDHMAIVHNLAAHIHRWQAAVRVRGFHDGLHGGDCAVHAGAEPPRISQNNMLAVAAHTACRSHLCLNAFAHPVRGTIHRNACHHRQHGFGEPHAVRAQHAAHVRIMCRTKPPHTRLGVHRDSMESSDPRRSDGIRSGAYV